MFPSVLTCVAFWSHHFGSRSETFFFSHAFHQQAVRVEPVHLYAKKPPCLLELWDRTCGTLTLPSSLARERLCMCVCGDQTMMAASETHSYVPLVATLPSLLLVTGKIWGVGGGVANSAWVFCPSVCVCGERGA